MVRECGGKHTNYKTIYILRWPKCDNDFHWIIINDELNIAWIMWINGIRIVSSWLSVAASVVYTSTPPLKTNKQTNKQTNKTKTKQNKHTKKNKNKNKTKTKQNKTFKETTSLRIDPHDKSQNALEKWFTIAAFFNRNVPCVYISVTKWCIVGFCDRSNGQLELKCFCIYFAIIMSRTQQIRACLWFRLWNILRDPCQCHIRLFIVRSRKVSIVRDQHSEFSNRSLMLVCAKTARLPSSLLNCKALWRF